MRKHTMKGNSLLTPQPSRYAGYTATQWMKAGVVFASTTTLLFTKFGEGLSYASSYFSSTSTVSPDTNGNAITMLDDQPHPLALSRLTSTLIELNSELMFNVPMSQFQEKPLSDISCPMSLALGGVSSVILGNPLPMLPTSLSCLPMTRANDLRAFDKNDALSTEFNQPKKPIKNKNANNKNRLVKRSATEFQVNTYATGAQTGASIAALNDGGFVVVWTDHGHTGSGDVYGQRYDANATTVGSEFLINTYTVGQQHAPPFQGITALNDGGFVVVWTSHGQDGDLNGVYAQRYDGDGARVGSEFRANTYTASNQMARGLSGLNDGGFIITWDSYLQDSHSFGVYAQRYTSDGNSDGNEFQINSYITDSQEYGVVAGLNDGGFVAAWMSDQDGDGSGIYAQSYATNGDIVVSEFQVNNYTLNAQLFPDIAALNNGGFVVIWQSQEQDGDSGGIYAKQYAANGNVIVDEFRVNTYTIGVQSAPAITSLKDGGYLITWRTADLDGDEHGVYGQRYDVNGISVDNNFQINSYFIGHQAIGSAAALSNGDIVVVWESNMQDGDVAGIFGKHFISPILINNALNISQAQQLTLTSDMLSATDADSNDADLMFNVSNIEYGQFEFSANPGVAITSFTQQQIIDSAVVFVHDGSTNIPTYRVSVSTGNPVTDTAPTSVIVNFSLTPTFFLETLGGNLSDYGSFVQAAMNKSYIITGATESFGTDSSQDLLLVKFDEMGSLNWSKTLGGNSSDAGTCVQVTPDEGYIVTGSTASVGVPTDSDLLLAKFDKMGDVNWAKTLGGNSSEQGLSIQITSDGGYLVVGFTRSFGAGHDDLLLTKFNETGALSWAKTVGGNAYDYAYCVQLTSDGGSILAGEYGTDIDGDSQDLLLAKFDGVGNLDWARTLGGNKSDFGTFVQVTPDGDYIVTGRTASFGAGSDDLLLAKFDDSGALSWAKTLGGERLDRGLSVQVTMDGDYIVTGVTRSFGSSSLGDLLLAKFNAMGNLIWAKALGGSGNDSGNMVQETPDGDYIVTGRTASFGAGNTDLLLARFNANGTIAGCNAVLDITQNITLTSINPTVNSTINLTVQTINPTVQDWNITAVNQTPNSQTHCVAFETTSSTGTTGTSGTTAPGTTSATTGTTGTTSVAASTTSMTGTTSAAASTTGTTGTTSVVASTTGTTGTTGIATSTTGIFSTSSTTSSDSLPVTTGSNQETATTSEEDSASVLESEAFRVASFSFGAALAMAGFAFAVYKHIHKKKEPQQNYGFAQSINKYLKLNLDDIFRREANELFKELKTIYALEFIHNRNSGQEWELFIKTVASVLQKYTSWKVEKPNKMRGCSSIPPSPLVKIKEGSMTTLDFINCFSSDSGKIVDKIKELYEVNVVEINVEDNNDLNNNNKGTELTAIDFGNGASTTEKNPESASTSSAHEGATPLETIVHRDAPQTSERAVEGQKQLVDDSVVIAVSEESPPADITDALPIRSSSEKKVRSRSHSPRLFAEGDNPGATPDETEDSSNVSTPFAI